MKATLVTDVSPVIHPVTKSLILCCTSQTLYIFAEKTAQIVSVCEYSGHREEAWEQRDPVCSPKVLN